ncbi:hypothetical protein BASA62_005599 [Batrachochytrium salamandrivorans]|nr:hypothetical protein BASA62_005599 [Batrachochytrium salamandrivorans]
MVSCPQTDACLPKQQRGKHWTQSLYCAMQGNGGLRAAGHSRLASFSLSRAALLHGVGLLACLFSEATHGRSVRPITHTKSKMPNGRQQIEHRGDGGDGAYVRRAGQERTIRAGTSSDPEGRRDFGDHEWKQKKGDGNNHECKRDIIPPPFPSWSSFVCWATSAIVGHALVTQSTAADGVFVTNHQPGDRNNSG